MLSRLQDRAWRLKRMLFSVGLVLACGCSDRSEVPRMDLTGRVTFNGQLVPRGSVRFRPDLDHGSSGPAAIAAIQDGVFKTPPGQGAVAGHMIVTIEGFDGIPYTIDDGGEVLTIEKGKPLFPGYETSVDISPETTQLDFAVPDDKR